MYERMHVEGEEIPIEEIAIASLEREIVERENRMDNATERANESRDQATRYDSTKRYEEARIEILIETVERLKDEL